MSKTFVSSINTQAAEILESALYAFMLPGVWGKGAFARRKDGEVVTPGHPKACTFCAIGALDAARVTLGHSEPARAAAICALNEEAQAHRLGAPYITMMDFNDSRNRKEPVLEVFAKAADKLRGL